MALALTHQPARVSSLFPWTHPRKLVTSATGPHYSHYTLAYSTSRTFYLLCHQSCPTLDGLLSSPRLSPWACCIKLAVLGPVLRCDKVPIIITLSNVLSESKSTISPYHLLCLYHALFFKDSHHRRPVFSSLSSSLCFLLPLSLSLVRRDP